MWLLLPVQLRRLGYYSPKARPIVGQSQPMSLLAGDASVVFLLSGLPNHKTHPPNL